MAERAVFFAALCTGFARGAGGRFGAAGMAEHILISYKTILFLAMRQLVKW